MASASFISEFAKKPPLVKVGAFFGIAVLLGLLYYQFVFSSVRADIKAAEAQRDSLAGQDATVRKDEGEYKEKTQQREQLEATINKNDDILPTAAQLPAFFDMLNRKVGEASVEVRKWEYQKEIPVEDFIKVPVMIEVQGTFQEIKKFFYLLYKMSQKEGEAAVPGEPTAPTAPTGIGSDDGDRILTIEDLTIRDPVVKNSELLLTATFRASTFRQDSKEPEVDEAAKAKDDKKKAKGKGKLDKVEDKVDAAMDKSEKRAGEAEPAGGSGAVKKGM